MHVEMKYEGDMRMTAATEPRMKLSEFNVYEFTCEIEFSFHGKSAIVNSGSGRRKKLGTREMQIELKLAYRDE